MADERPEQGLVRVEMSYDPKSGTFQLQSGSAPTLLLLGMLETAKMQVLKRDLKPEVTREVLGKILEAEMSKKVAIVRP